jgi:hypothetical protein
MVISNTINFKKIETELEDRINRSNVRKITGTTTNIIKGQHNYSAINGLL